MYNLQNKIALVTGGAKGIGAEIVKKILLEGAKYVAILDMNEADGLALEAELASKYGKKAVKFIKCDVTNDDQLFGAFKTAGQVGYIDLVVNNAGIFQEDLKTYKKEIDINFTAVVTSTLKALELMRKDHGGKGGTVINISSMAALFLFAPSMFVYSATKHAVLNFSTTIGLDTYYNITNVRTLTICFGLTETGIVQEPRSFDPLVPEAVRSAVQHQREHGETQSSESAAEGVISAYKQGKSATTWLVSCGNPAVDITPDIKSAYEIMGNRLNLPKQ